jgi:asparagine synthase (glutamine-hydrolysing)
MSAQLAHRGPDSDGLYAGEGCALGFRRLAIIDPTPAGDQPFASDDGRLRLIHNGEVYNYRELRSELETRGHRFRSATDTEVVLAAYREWGTSCVERFNGMWAFAVWDEAEQRLFCSRDRFGVKPFYYRIDGSRFTFASEPKAFEGLEGAPRRAEPGAVLDYLEQGYLDHGETTFFDGVRRLLPAHSLVFDRNGLRTERYWRLEPNDAPADAVEAVRELFLDAVRLRLRSDVPVGTALSGGLDSSAIAVTIGRLLTTEAENARAVGPRQRTFTAYFEDSGFDERPYAKLVIDATRAEPHWITFTAEELTHDLPAIVRSQDEPFGSTSQVAQWYVMRTAAGEGLKVMLDGQGGDEVLAGYRAFVGFHLADLIAGGRARTLLTELASFRSQLGAPALATAALRPFAPERLTRFVRSRTRATASLVHRELRAAAPPELNGDFRFGTRLRRHQQLILGRRGLPELLRYEDRNSMAHSLEARVPFLDYRLVELLFSLPSEELIRNGRTKSILRRALSDLLPEPVRERTDKLGFVTPERRFLRGALGELAADVFASRSFAERGFVDTTAVRRRLEQHRREDVDAGFELWRALNLELWAREFIDR